MPYFISEKLLDMKSGNQPKELIMETRKCGFSLVDLTIILCLVALLVTGLLGGITKARKAEEEARKANRGYPASSLMLKDDVVYLLNASIVEEHPSQTNFLAVLQEIKVMASDSYLQVGTNRLMELTETLSRGKYYRTSKSADGKIVFTEIAPPVARLEK